MNEVASCEYKFFNYITLQSEHWKYEYFIISKFKKISGKILFLWNVKLLKVVLLCLKYKYWLRLWEFMTFPPTFIPTWRPVSYTHLDVYKRQRLKKNECSCKEAAGLTNMISKNEPSLQTSQKISGFKMNKNQFKPHKIAMVTTHTQHCIFCSSNSHNIYSCLLYTSRCV